MTIASGGVLPRIQPELLAKKKGRFATMPSPGRSGPASPAPTTSGKKPKPVYTSTKKYIRRPAAVPAIKSKGRGRGKVSLELIYFFWD